MGKLSNDKGEEEKGNYWRSGRERSYSQPQPGNPSLRQQSSPEKFQGHEVFEWMEKGYLPMCRRRSQLQLLSAIATKILNRALVGLAVCPMRG